MWKTVFNEPCRSPYGTEILSKKTSNDSELRFKEKQNIFQCLNVPFINDILFLFLGDGVGGRKSYAELSPPFLA